ncbi:DUF6526 family protein [Paenibacillus yanchengensis]|uniref:DUF6526 family protein n=1 Tax=Paenibacillus yanchengensis TaxID=2035833 RepID=A0ABW4YP01_9BACL
MSQQQDAKNHTRYHPLQHFFWLPLSAITILTSLVALITALVKGSSALIYGLVLAAAFIGLISGFLARRNALIVQDRVIRMEEQFRYYRLAGKMPSEKITVKQWIALRFASNEEFVALADQAAQKNMAGSDIKASIKQWRADEYRV